MLVKGDPSRQRGSTTMRILDEFEGKRLLCEWGIPVVEEALAATEEEAVDAAGRLGFPVALKVCSPEIAHKTEAGGVVLDIPDTTSLLSHAREMRSRFAGVPHALLVQRMAPKGAEIIIGARRDAVFGPVVLAGMGGILAEIIRDTALELAPITERRALAMLQRLKAWPILSGFRGGRAVDVRCVARALAALSRLVARRRDIVEVDVNPLMALPEGAVAVDALVRVANGDFRRARDRVAGPLSVDPFFNPRSFALLGASRSHGKGGNIILRNVLKAGFKGPVYPINPSGHEILGIPSHRRLTDVPGEVDLAMIVIPKPAVKDAIRDCAAKGVRAVILCTGGYADAGEKGASEQDVIARLARESGFRLMGPNSIGVINPAVGLATSIVGLEPIMQGGVALVGQSGVFSSGWGRWIAQSRPFGVSKIACIGNKADVDESDLLEYLAHDGNTTTIGLYLEGVACGERF
ncbi:MAG TPA: acetate--CoA ligase family protein, partial [Deltaproteobacteria bacterium]|nr:acetate--CoA ligase family protein [Deltaproteobacteria bacterium]